MILEVRDLTVEVGSFTLSNVNLSLEKGSLGILGPTASGKTTLIETVAGFHRRNTKSGRVLLRGVDVTDLSPEERHIGYLPQDLALYPFLTVRKNIAFGIRNKNDRIVDELATILGIDQLLDRTIAALSGGEKQRTALARALAVKPDIVFFDEPFSSLDPVTGSRLLLEIRRLQRELDFSLVQVTHNFEDAYFLCDTLAIFKDGHLVQTGPKEEIFERPSSLFSARFTGMHNIFFGRVEKGRVACDFGTLFVNDLNGFADGDDVHIAVRPENIMIIREEKKLDGGLRENVFSGHIIELSKRINSVSIIFRLDLGHEFLISIPLHIYERLGLENKINEPMRVALRSNKIHVFGSGKPF